MQYEDLIMITLEEMTKLIKRIEGMLFEMKKYSNYKKYSPLYVPERVIIDLYSIPSSKLKYLKTVDEYRKEYTQFLNEWSNDKKSGLSNEKENEYKREAIEKIIVIEFVRAYQKYLEESNG